MPSFTIHIAIAKVYLQRHPEINEHELIRGVIAPDLLPKPKSHYGSATSNPGLDSFITQNGLEDDYSKGYYLHLKTDLLFYQEFLNMEQFSKEIYQDYDKINQCIIDKYQLDIPLEVTDFVRFQKGCTRILNLEDIFWFIDLVGNLELMEQYCLTKVKLGGSLHEHN